MKFLTQNSKLKKTSKLEGLRAFNFGIPAFKSNTGLVTCPNAGACAVGCYAQAGAYRFKNVAAAFEKRLAAALNREPFYQSILAELDKNRVDVLRIHDSGDFFSAEYWYTWNMIIKARPKVQFYAYTKQVSFFKARKLPKNLKIIYSFGGTEDKLIDVEKDRHSLVFETLDELKKAGYVDVTENDLNALKGTKVGLVYHGTKAWSNTYWARVKQLKKERQVA